MISLLEQELTQQRSPQWHAQRLGWITASQVHKLMGKPKSGKWTQTALTYLDERVYERCTRLAIESKSSAATDWGITHEAEAIAYSGLPCKARGFIPHATIDYFGGSPDGVEPLIEVKCPYNPVNHFAYWQHGEIPTEYYWQMQTLMLLTDQTECIFLSYDPRCNEKFRLYKRVIQRNDEDIAKLLERVQEGLQYIAEEVSKL